MTKIHRWILGALIILVAAEVVWWLVGGDFKGSIRSMVFLAVVAGLLLHDWGWWKDESTDKVGLRTWWRPW